MIIAKVELLNLLKENEKTLKAAAIEHGLLWEKGSWSKSYLYEGYTKEEYAELMENLNFIYDEGFGSRMLHGVLWFTDGTHARRVTYDGAEWWMILDVPPTPQRGEYLENAENYAIGGY